MGKIQQPYVFATFLQNTTHFGKYTIRRSIIIDPKY